MNLEQELSLFSNFAGKESSECRISEVGPSILHLKSKSNKSGLTLGYMAMVHGNEYLGLPILNSFIQSILAGEIEVQADIYFALGNIPAAFANKRFIDEDLNRAFGKLDNKTSESKRARELEALMLKHCDFLLDIHQTIHVAENPFFIFQYSDERCLSIMEKWNPGIPVILQEDQIGEDTGLSADEYLRSLKKFGTALELGQLGTFDHFNLGLGICKRVLYITTKELLNTRSFSDSFSFQILKLEGSCKVKNSTSSLDEGWKNLKSFTIGERLGTSEDGMILAPTSGYMLFPRYRALSEGEDLFYYCTQWDSGRAWTTNALNKKESLVSLY